MSRRKLSNQLCQGPARDRDDDGLDHYVHVDDFEQVIATLAGVTQRIGPVPASLVGLRQERELRWMLDRRFAIDTQLRHAASMRVRAFRSEPPPYLRDARGPPPTDSWSLNRWELSALLSSGAGRGDVMDGSTADKTMRLRADGVCAGCRSERAAGTRAHHLLRASSRGHLNRLQPRRPAASRRPCCCRAPSLVAAPAGTVAASFGEVRRCSTRWAHPCGR